MEEEILEPEMEELELGLEEIECPECEKEFEAEILEPEMEELELGLEEIIEPELEMI